MEDNQDFIDHISKEQSRIYNYIVSLIGRQESAWDILQETNRVLWLKKDDFREGTNFYSWALTTAQFQIKAFIRDNKRSKVILSEELVDIMAKDAEEMNELQSDRLKALRTCVLKLKDDHQSLIWRRYIKMEKLEDIALNSSYTANALKQIFFRIRKKLKNCIDGKVIEDSNSFEGASL